jgi:hypothetical protein
MKSLLVVALLLSASACWGQSPEQDQFQYGTQYPIGHMYGMQAGPRIVINFHVYRHWYWPWKKHIRVTGICAEWAATVGSQEQLDIGK